MKRIPEKVHTESSAKKATHVVELAGTWLLVETEKRPVFKPLEKEEYQGIEVAEPLKAPRKKVFDRVEI